MKLNRKWFLVIALVLSLTMATAGTLAYLTDRDTVENTFTMGNVDIEVEEDFPDGNIKPGETVNKDAKITNKGSNPAWVWMTVSVPEGLKDYVTMNWANGFTPTDDSPVVENGQAVWTVLVDDQLPAGEATEYILDSVTLSGLVDYQGGKYVVVEDGEVTDLEGIVDGKMVVTVNGYATQVDGLDTVEEAYAAYQGQWGSSDPSGAHVCWNGTSDTSWYNDTDTEFTITTAEQLAGLAELVDGGNTFEGKTVKLGNDICLGCPDKQERVTFNPIGHSSNGKSFNGTFDGQDHKISNMYMQSNLDSNNGGWLYEGEYYGLFAYTDGATIKNVTVEDAYISSGRNEAAAIVGNAVSTSFKNISVEGVTLIGYNNSVGGVASECYGTCSFTDITVDENTVVGALWATYDVRLGGVVGMIDKNATASFSDVVVSCQLDAFNDVTSSYKWGSYRLCGMLIGQVPTEINPEPGIFYPDPANNGITCQNVTVKYGDWVDQHYCYDDSFSKGCQRVEAGLTYGGVDIANYPDATIEEMTFDQIFGGNQSNQREGHYGIAEYTGVIVVYPD